jgi:hypothetical protein
MSVKNGFDVQVRTDMDCWFVKVSYGEFSIEKGFLDDGPWRAWRMCRFIKRTKREMSKAISLIEESGNTAKTGKV